ncbi:MAG TPA: hypothetical protein VLH79_09760 [Chthonomonadales bacterium]|nr:hypothetical protein [Chthonomonadales bacterium]
MVPLAQVITGTGELLEQTSPLSGGAWTTSAQILKGLTIVRRNAEVHHFDPLGNAGVITGSGAAVDSSALYDAFGAGPRAGLAMPQADQGRLAA